MSKAERNAANVGVGTLQKPDEDEYGMHEGWLMFQKQHMDNSVNDSVDFAVVPTPLKGRGPHKAIIPKYPNAFADPSSFRLQGEAIVKCLNNGVWGDLPKIAVETHNPNQAASIQWEQHTLTNEEKADIAKPLEMWTKHKVLFVGADEATGIALKPTKQDPKFAANTIAEISPVQYLVQSMWKDIEVKLNGMIVTKNANLEYAYKAYIEKLLTYSEESMDTHQQAECFIKDVPYMGDFTKYEKEKIDDWPAEFAKTKNHHRRRAAFCNDKPFQFSMALHTELNSIPTFLLDNIEYEFTFTRNSNEFIFTSGKNNTTNVYELEFTNLFLTGRFMKPSPMIEKKISQWLSKGDAVYHTVRTEIQTSLMNKGATTHLYNNIFNSNQLPEQLFCFMVRDVAKSGSYEHDPFFFYHYDVNSIHLQVNNRNLPSNPLTPDFSTDKGFLQCYRELFESTSIKLQNIATSITPEKFRWGTTIFGWDLNHDKCAGQHGNHSEIFGAASLYLKFKNPLPHNVSLMVAAVYRDYLTIDEYRHPNVLSSFGIANLYKQHDIM